MKTLYIERELSTGNISNESLLYDEPKSPDSYAQPVLLSDEDYEILIGKDIEAMKSIVEKTLQKARWGNMSKKYKKS